MVTQVTVEGRSGEQALQPFDQLPHRAAVRAISLGTLRWYLRLAPAIDSLLAKPDRLLPDVRALLVVGAHQIAYSRNAPQLMVHWAVDATRLLDRGHASGLVNAVLRRFVAERTELLAKTDGKLPQRTAHPAWLVSAIEQAWPHQLEDILAANNEQGPLVLRVDLSRQSREPYLADLSAAGIGGQAVEWLASAVRIDPPIAVRELPGFAEGVVSVQDAGAQLAAELLAAQPGMRVLDACAAPGGKTGHLLERSGSLDLTAVDIAPERLARVQENLLRLGRTARLVAGDVRQPDSFWDGVPYERILVDAPCSSTGVIRRHPDIKLLRRASDISAFAATQLELLSSAFRMLAPLGRLLYSTCSVLPAENEAVVAEFLRSEPGAREVRLPTALAPGAHGRSLGWQLLPGGEAGTDGFYYACLEKTTTGT